MDQPIKERRRLSQSGLLETAIRSAARLVSAQDATTRALVNQMLSALMQLRRTLPQRRQADLKTRKD
jgi:hypothetical protein